MKIIARTFAILAVAALIVGGLLALGATTSLASGGERPDFAAAAQASASATDTASATASGTASDTSSTTSTAAPPHREGGEGASLFGAVEILKNLAIVGVITAIVAGGKRLLGRRPPAPRPQAAA